MRKGAEEMVMLEKLLLRKCWRTQNCSQVAPQYVMFKADEEGIVSANYEENGLNNEEIFTCDGSVDWRSRRSIKSKTGGWNVGILLLVNQGLATLALFGVSVNLVVFMTRVLHQDNAEAAKNVSMWTGTAYFCSLVGAFISDSYWGRYKTCAIFQFIFVCGLVELTLSAHFLLKKKGSTGPEILIFKLSIYQIALGNGGYQPAAATFGADQFDENDPIEGKSKITYFSYFYLANNLGTLFSNTILAYLEDKGKWVLSFGISAAAAFMALLFFIAGNHNYRYFKPGGNPLSRACQVIIASIRKCRLVVPNDADELYEVERVQYMINGRRKILHTPDLKFLDRAAIVTQDDFACENENHCSSPWSLCTVTQIEELKCIIRLIPIWLCTIIYSVVYTQMASVFIEQGAAMRTTIATFQIPPASMSIFEILGVALFILLYRLCITPLLYQFNKSWGLTELKKMGVGLIGAAITMIFAGIVETMRLKYANNGSSSLSILWQMPQYVVMGASEVFMYVAQLEFFNSQAPDGLKSFGSALYLASMSAGNYVSSLLVTVVMKITGRGDKKGWISQDLNKGHMDRFYFLLAALTAIDIVIFLASANSYRCISLEGKSKETDDNDSAARNTGM